MRGRPWKPIPAQTSLSEPARAVGVYHNPGTRLIRPSAFHPGPARNPLSINHPGFDRGRCGGDGLEHFILKPAVARNSTIEATLECSRPEGSLHPTQCGCRFADIACGRLFDPPHNYESVSPT